MFKQGRGCSSKPPTIFTYGDLLHPHGESDSQMVFILLTGSISSYITIGRTLGNKLRRAYGVSKA